MYFKRVRVLSVLLLFLISACRPWNYEEGTATDTAASPVMIMAAGAEIPLAVRATEEKKSDQKVRQAQYKAIIEQQGAGDIPYVQLGEIIEFSLEEKIDAGYELTDVLLMPDGSYKYIMPDNDSGIVEINGGAGSFKLGINPAAFLSSNTADYEPGAILRGFVLTGVKAGEQREIFLCSGQMLEPSV